MPTRRTGGKSPAIDRPPDPARVERFRADLARVWPEDTRLGVAVSGGPDSLALLLLAHAALPGRVEAATVDHALRPESAGEAAMVARVCAAMDVPHATLRVVVPPGNLQDRARVVRYQALGGWVEARGLGALATAHHMDDQAETLLMRLNRGSGVAGLAGVRALSGIPGTGGKLIRPLLGWRRAELGAVVRDAGLEPVADPSNLDERFDRVRMRRALAEADWIEVPALARSAGHLAEAAEAIAFMVGREWAECVAETDGGFRYAALRTGLPDSNVVRIGVIEAVARALGGTLDAGSAAHMARSLIAGQPCNVGGIEGRMSDEEGERFWLFARETPRRAG